MPKNERTDVNYTPLITGIRPKVWGEFVYNGHIIAILRNMIVTGRIPSSILFSGIRGVGKTTSARLFARALSCENAVEGDPCNECESCIASLNDNHPDILEISGSTHGNIEDIRYIIDQAMMSPMHGKYKIFIIDEVQGLGRSQSSFDALLKILEEPPPHVVWIFCTSQPSKLPETIKSRLLSLPLKIVPTSIISDYLQYVLTACLGLNPETIHGIPDVIARASNNSIRDSLTLLEKIKAYCDTAGWSVPNVLSLVNTMDLATLESLLATISSFNSVGLWALFGTLLEEGYEADQLYDTLCQIISTMLSLNLNASVDNIEIYQKYRQAIPLNRLIYLSNLLMGKQEMVKQAGNKKLVLQTLSLELCT